MEEVIVKPLPKITKEKYQDFLAIYMVGKKYRGMLKGMAFYQHFNLHKVKDQSLLKNLKSLNTGKEFSKLLFELFNIK